MRPKAKKRDTEYGVTRMRLSKLLHEVLLTERARLVTQIQAIDSLMELQDLGPVDIRVPVEAASEPPAKKKRDKS